MTLIDKAQVLAAVDGHRVVSRGDNLPITVDDIDNNEMIDSILAAISALPEAGGVEVAHSEHTDGAHYDQRRREAGVMTKDVAADVLAFWMLPFDMPPLEQTEARNAIKAAILTLTRSASVVDASPLASAERVVEAAKEMRLEMRCTYGWDSQHDNPVPCTTKAGHPCDCSVCDSARAFDQSLREGGR